MAYLATVRSYDNQTEAEIDKSLLEGNGVTVFLLNHGSSISQIGGLLRIQLQVPDEEAARAVSILQVHRPWIMGSSEVGRNIDRAIRRALIRYVLTAAACIPVLFTIFYFAVEQELEASAAHSIVVAPFAAFPFWAIVEIVAAVTKKG